MNGRNTYNNFKLAGIIKLHVFLMVIILIFCHQGNLQAQDIHFSQFYASPLLLNPSNTGLSDEGFRFANTYRNQWARIGIPFQTISSSLDGKIIVAGQTIGLGGLVIYDQSSSYNLSADEFMISFSYSRVINNQQFTIGIQPGIVFKSFNLKDLTFYSQFDPSSQLFNSSLPNFESGLDNHLRYFDINFGISWCTLISTIIPSAGISVNHLNMPLERFETSSSGKRLPVRITFNSEVTIPLKSRINLIPCALYSYTPGAYELIIGSIGGYGLNSISIPVKEIYATTMFRLNPPRDIDALILGGGVKFLKMDLGITYDFNVSPLHRVASLNGAFEVSLIYTGRKHAQKNANQPCFIVN